MIEEGKQELRGAGSRDQVLHRIKEELLDGLSLCEMDNTPVVPSDITLPGRMFFDAKFQLQSAQALMRRAGEEQMDSSVATREALDHMIRVAPKKVAVDPDLPPPIPSAEEKLEQGERLLAAGNIYESHALFTQVAEMRDEFEPSLQLEQSTALQAATATEHLGDMACGQRKPALAEELYTLSLALLKESQEQQYDRTREVLAKIISTSLLLTEEVDEEGTLIHRDEGREDTLKGLLCDATLLLQMPGGATVSELHLSESVAKAQAGLGRWDEAELLYARAVELAAQLYSESDPGAVATVMARVASLLSDELKLENALEYAEGAVRLLKEHQSGTQAVTLLQCCAVATIYFEQKRHEEAKKILEEATPMLCEELGPMHISVAFVLRDYAEVCFALGLRQESKMLFKQAYEAMKAHPDCFGEDDMVRVYNGTKMHIEI